MDPYTSGSGCMWRLRRAPKGYFVFIISSRLFWIIMSAWPRTASTRENTLLKHGGGPLNDVYKILDGQNLGLTKPERMPNITTPHKFAHRCVSVGDAVDNSHRTWLGMTGLDLTADQFVDIPVISRTQSSEKRDSVVIEQQDQTLKNKRILLSENRITGTSATAGDLATFQDVGAGVIELRRTAKGTAGQYPIMNPSANGITWQTPGTDIGSNVITDSMIASHTSTKITITNKSHLPADAVYTNDTQTLLNKTLTSPTIATILNGAGVTLTLPGSTQNILGRTTIDTLTNKNIDTITNTLKNVGIYKYQIFKDGSTYYLRNNQTGAIEVSNASPNTIFSFVFTNGGSCYVHGPIDYVLTGTPSVYFDLPLEPTKCEVYMSRDAFLVVPNGYTGTVVRMQNSTTVHNSGHRIFVNIKEAGTAAQNWIGILIEGIGGTNIRGVYDCGIVGGEIRFPDIGVKFNNDSTSTKGFLTGNFAENMLIWGPKTAGVDFGMDITYTLTPDINGIHRHRFRNILVQFITISGGNPGSSTSCVAFRNIRHRDLKFDGCYAADFPNNGTAKTATIHTDADSVIIDGGTLDVTSMFTDNSTLQTTKIRSQYRHTQIGKITPGGNGQTIEIIPTGGTNTTSWWNSSLNERFWISKSSTDWSMEIVKQTGGTQRNLIFRQNDASSGGSGQTESFRMETDGSLRVFTNKLKLRDSDDTHNITITVPNITSNWNLAIPTLTGNDTFLTASGAAIGDAAIASHTSTKITITAKGQLNSQIAYKDENTWLTNAMVSASAAIGWTKISKTGSLLSDMANVILTTPAQYDVLYRDGSGNWINLPKGTNNKFLGISTSGVFEYNYINNANIFPHTSTVITITAKGQLNSQIGYKDDSSWVTDAMMASHTSTKITITAKAQLNSQIAYKDETAWWTESMSTLPFFQLIKLPVFGKKKGGFAGTSSGAGWGIVGTFTALGTFVALDIDTTYGSYVPRITGTTAGNNAGWSYSNALSMRKFNPILAVLARPTHVSLNRMYIGWKSTAASPTALTDDPLSGLSGVMFLQRSGDTTWQIISNNGTGSTIVDTTTSISTTVPTNLQIRADDANSKFQWSTDGGTTWTDVTGTFPAQTTKLFYVGELQTNEAGVAHTLHTFAIEIASDK